MTERARLLAADLETSRLRLAELSTLNSQLSASLASERASATERGWMYASGIVATLIAAVEALKQPSAELTQTYRSGCIETKAGAVPYGSFVAETELAAIRNEALEEALTVAGISGEAALLIRALKYPRSATERAAEADTAMPRTHTGAPDAMGFYGGHSNAPLHQFECHNRKPLAGHDAGSPPAVDALRKAAAAAHSDRMANWRKQPLKSVSFEWPFSLPDNGFRPTDRSRREF